MKLRFLLAITCSVLPLAVHAQPVTGPYVNLAGGVNILNTVHYNFNNAHLSGKFVFRDDYIATAGVGYGFGDGLRVELDGDFLRSTLHKYVRSTSSRRDFGGQQTYGPMLNVLYDIPAGLPFSTYIGAGLGYQYVQLKPSFGNAKIRLGGTKGSFAYDAILGLAYPLQIVPGLALTAEYRFMQVTSDRSYPLTGGSGGTATLGALTSNIFLVGLRYQLFNPPAAAPPVAPTPAPVAAAPAPGPVRTYLVFFGWDKANLTTRATQIIAQAASNSKTGSITELDVSGYTDTSGTAQYNQGLSLRRAHAVAAQLVADSIPASEIQIKGYGETHLLVATGPDVREPQNRRVEIVLN